VSFSTPLFLFIFFPIMYIGYLFLPKKLRNAWLLLSSLVFYTWSGFKFLIVLLLFTIINYSFGLLIENDRKKAILIFAVVCDLSFLLWYKYANFILMNIASLLPVKISVVTKSTEFTQNFIMPMGLSFFTFRGVSYIADIYKDKVKACKNFGGFLLYMVMFPYIISGPIVRYTEISGTVVANKTIDTEEIYTGLKRFVYGLSKKVLIADVLGEAVTRVFVSSGSIVSWLGMIIYSLQLYFDFSGYSDMAIGIGNMLGYHFCENFDNPYKARSIKEFWRRWHISLSNWFRDYLYIPLGGNRKGTLATYRNLMVVFLATGLWHGASWNFVVWGLWHGVFMLLERVGLDKILKRLPVFIQRIYTLLIVGIGWLMFRSVNIIDNLKIIANLFTFKESETYNWIGYMDLRYTVCILLATAWCAIGADRILKNKLWSDIVVFAMLILSVISISASNFSPFLYLRF
jgi:membrane bound O-acyl transferase MBOAT family protein